MNHILFNGLHYTKNGAGISKYTGELVKEFQKKDYEVDLLMRNEWKETFQGNKNYFVGQEITSSTKRIIEEQYQQLKRYKSYDLIHFPDYASPVFYKGKKIVTIHDMAMHTMRNKYTLSQNLTKNILLRHTIRYADRLICISEFSKRELLKYYPQVEEKVNVIYSGVSIPKYNTNEKCEAEVLEKLGVPNDYILYVGTIAPHKNIEQLIKAYKKLHKSGCNHKLIIVGKRGWMDEKIMACASKEGIENEVVFTGFVTDDELEVLYRKAAIFVSVSLYEGFGFPPLEAMGRGCPTLVSHIDAFREICQNHALYCDPNDSENIAIQMERLLTDNGLRQKLIKGGLEHTKRFSWERTARQTYLLYKEVLEKR